MVGPQAQAVRRRANPRTCSLDEPVDRWLRTVGRVVSCLDDGTQMQMIRRNAITDSRALIANELRVEQTDLCQLWYYSRVDRTETARSPVCCDAVAIDGDTDN
jgi:hypothetical protein